MLAVGSVAPAFTLPDQTGKQHSLSDERGKWVLVYFYPKDDTPGCTIEACGIRDSFDAFTEAGVTVFGVSKDSVESHDAFVKKFHLPFALLADTDMRMMTEYGAGVQKTTMGVKKMGTHRISYVIDPQGKIAKVYPAVKPEEHAEEILRDIESMA